MFVLLQKLEENGITESKGKGKGKGKGKSSLSSPKTSGDCVQETKTIIQAKRASKSAAELYKDLLNDDGTEEDILEEEDDSDEDVVYGQDDSDSDDGEEVLP